MDTINIDIDVTKISKARLKVVNLKNGTEAKYLKATLVPSPNNQYGNDYFIAESTTKEERQAGMKGTIIGNARINTFNKPASEPQRQPAAPAPAKETWADGSEIPF